MSKKFNFAFNLSIYSDTQSNANPMLRDVFIVRNLLSDDLMDIIHDSDTIDPSATSTIFDGSRSFGLDALAQGTISYLSGDIYKLSINANSGTFSGFRASRAVGLDNTSQITFTKITPSLMTLSISAGTAWDLSSVQVNDEIRFESAANVNVGNQGTFKIKTKSSSTLTIENPSGINETIIINSAANVLVYSSIGVQFGDNLVLGAPFNVNNRDTYTILDVTPNYVEFANDLVVPEGPIAALNSGGLTIYNKTFKILYLEVTEGSAAIMLNGSSDLNQVVAPFDENTPGIYFKMGNFYRVDIKNLSDDEQLSFRIVASQKE